MILEDGTGTGNKVGINHDNQLLIYGVVESEASFEGEQHGQLFSWTYKYDVDALDTVLWLRNDSSTNRLHISTIHVSTDNATWFQIHFPENTTNATGTAITGINMNLISGNPPTATCYGDETTNSQSSVFCNYYLPAGSVSFNVDGKIILGKNDIIALDFTTATTSAGSVTFVGYFKEEK